MRWKIPHRRLWFAWHPVRTKTGVWVWLERVWRERPSYKYSWNYEVNE